MDDTHTCKFSEPVYPTPENPRVSSLPETPDVIDSPILPVKEDTLTNSVKGEMKMNMECDSVFKCYSPDISSPLNSNLSLMEKSINSLSDISNPESVIQPALKHDATTQVEYHTQNNFAQADYSQ